MSNKPIIKLRATVRPLSENIQSTAVEKSVSHELASSADFDNSEFYRPRKKQISIRLDADILAWFQENYDKYQSAINQACRVYMRLKEHEKAPVALSEVL